MFTQVYLNSSYELEFTKINKPLLEVYTLIRVNSVYYLLHLLISIFYDYQILKALCKLQS